MALDKIFIPENHLNDGGIEDFWVDHKTFDTDIEYVRKDALLEWAKVYKEEAEVSARGRTDNPSWGECVAIKSLIDFINSL